MKHLTLAAALSIVSAVPVFAQDGGTPSSDASVAERGPRAHGHPGRHGRRGHDPEARLQHMQQELSLTPAQVQQLRQLFTDARARREQNRQARQQEHEAMRARVDAILTPEQRQRAQALRSERQQQRVTRRLERMTERLSLRPNQVTQIRRILEQTRARHEALGRGPEHREEHRALREQTKTQIDAVLDAEQRAQADQMRERREGRHGRHGRGPRGEGRGNAGQGRGRGPQKA
ncbi:MAG: hypothetical protein H6722_21270 [Sandaracinus sp.]|nr:hypothetical protein [Sandaracinus sp.]MCB9614975.1 hypothetical protein [Sandaracinus sp.]